MPQLDFSTFLPQIFWLAVTFIVLYALMKAVALPQVGRAIEARRRQIDDDLAQAGQMKGEAEAVLAAYEKALSEARAQAQTVLRETGERLTAEAAGQQRQLAAELAEQITAAEAQIAAAKADAVAEIRGVAVEAAGAVAEKLTGTAGDPVKTTAAVDRVMAERAL
jgi:F-type H+-transporting ATPase subunit b